MSDLWTRMDVTGTYPVEMKSYAVDGWLRLPSGIAVEDAVALMSVDGSWLPRPRIDPPLMTEATDGLSIVFTALPEQTDIVVTDVASGDLLARLVGPDVEIELVDQGVYFIEATAPLPYMPFEMRVAVK